MKIRLASGALVAFLLLASYAVRGQQLAVIEMFSPQGEVKSIRQVQARFSEPMVPLGDPREVVTPFDVSCPEKGAGRWADGRNWVYDFDKDLPAGVRCEFKVREGLKTLAGKEIGGQKGFWFSTGGPSILTSSPDQGSESIDEEQIFILE